MGKILVIGAANIDLLAFPQAELRMRDSNIGAVHFSYGGVGRNVAVNLARLGNEVSFLTAFGNDAFGSMLRAELESLGIDLSAALSIDKRSGMYLAVHDAKGDLAVAVCDNEIAKAITPAYLREHHASINSFTHFFFDANLSPEALAFLFDNVRGKIYFDATSVAKSGVIKPYLARISLLKGNRAEIGALVHGAGDIEAEIKTLLAAGTERVVATNGAEAVHFNLGKKIISMPVPPANVVSTNGSGDAFMSGVIHGLINEKAFEEGIAYGIKAAAATLSVFEACNPDLNKYFKEEV